MKNKNTMPKERLDITKLDFSNGEDTPVGRVSPPREGSASASRIKKSSINPGHESSNSNLTKNGKMIPLPVSRKEVFGEFIELDPEACYVSDKNKRQQSLLSTDNPEIQKLKAELKLGQRDEILVRMVDGKPEVIYGSRRLFCTKSNNEDFESEGKPLVKIKALVADIPDEDVEALSDSENDSSVGISPYERGLYWKTLKEDNQWSDEVVAHHVGISRSVVSESILLAGLDESIVKLLLSPTLLTISSGLPICKIVSKLDRESYEEFIDSMKDMKLDSSLALLNALKIHLNKMKNESTDDQDTVTVKKPRVITNSVGKTTAKISKHRTKKGQYKVDVYHLSEENLEKLTKFLEDSAG